jgi:Fuc2NAc and GlcNAc transferase
MFGTVALAASIGVIALIATERVRCYAVRSALIDVPNERSSHSIPTPRGGGVAIVLSLLLGIGLAALFGWVSDDVTIALVGGGVLTAAVGFLDDERDIGAGPRAALHLVAAAWAVFWLGGVPAVHIGSHTVQLGLAGSALAILGVAWLINLYNFMDGIDGLAGSQAVVAGGLGATLLFTLGHTGLGLVSLLVAAAAAGFMYWNWEPARIFMGDVGSSFLGFVFGVLALASEAAGAVPLTGWLLLLGVFIFDATATLIRRVAAGERWYEAHRKHAYQRLLAAGWSHGRVTGFAIAAIVVMGGFAAAGTVHPELMPALIVAGVSVLAALYLAIESITPMPLAAGGAASAGAARNAAARSAHQPRPDMLQWRGDARGEAAGGRQR